MKQPKNKHVQTSQTSSSSSFSSIQSGPLQLASRLQLPVKSRKSQKLDVRNGQESVEDLFNSFLQELIECLQKLQLRMRMKTYKNNDSSYEIEQELQQRMETYKYYDSLYKIKQDKMT